MLNICNYFRSRHLFGFMFVSMESKQLKTDWQTCWKDFCKSFASTSTIAFESCMQSGLSSPAVSRREEAVTAHRTSFACATGRRRELNTSLPSSVCCLSPGLAQSDSLSKVHKISRETAIYENRRLSVRDTMEFRSAACPASIHMVTMIPWWWQIGEKSNPNQRKEITPE